MAKGYPSPYEDISMPVKAPISTPYGSQEGSATKENDTHEGVDFEVSEGAVIRATAAGRAVRVSLEKKKGSGRTSRVLEIDHGNGNTSIYENLTSIWLEVGDTVAKGQDVGELSGNTGSTKAQLHYEERYQNRPHPPTFDPANYQP